jgi:MGT family glycosyltransferase
LTAIHVLILCIPRLGHVLPALAIAGELARRGHRVSFVATHELAAPVAASGAELITYSSTWPSMSRPDPQVEIPADAVTWAPLIFLTEGRAATTAARVTIGAGPFPDLIVYDATLGHSAHVLAREWDVPSAQLVVTFAANENFSPITPPGLTSDNPALAAYRGATTEMLSAHGLSDLDFDGFAGAGDDLSIVLLSREFQIAGDTFGDRFRFVGAALSPRRDVAAVTGRRSSSRHWKPPGDGLPLLFADLAAFGDRRPGMLRACVDAFAQQPWRVVIAVGDRLDPAVEAGLPANVEVHRDVCAPDVLAHASVLLAHAGMGSATQAQHFGVPMVAVPLTPQQQTIAERVVELCLGTSIEPGAVTAAKVREAVLAVSYDDGIRRVVATMRKHSDQAGGVVAAADALEALPLD